MMRIMNTVPTSNDPRELSVDALANLQTAEAAARAGIEVPRPPDKGFQTDPYEPTRFLPRQTTSGVLDRQKREALQAGHTPVMDRERAQPDVSSRAKQPASRLLDPAINNLLRLTNRYTLSPQQRLKLERLLQDSA